MTEQNNAKFTTVSLSLWTLSSPLSLIDVQAKENSYTFLSFPESCLFTIAHLICNILCPGQFEVVVPALVLVQRGGCRESSQT